MTEDELGKLLPFERRDRGQIAERIPYAGASEVVLFTGVRYEREPGPPPKPSASAGAKRKRG